MKFQSTTSQLRFPSVLPLLATTPMPWGISEYPPPFLQMAHNPFAHKMSMRFFLSSFFGARILSTPYSACIYFKIIQYVHCCFPPPVSFSLGHILITLDLCHLHANSLSLGSKEILSPSCSEILFNYFFIHFEMYTQPTSQQSLSWKLTHNI